MYVPSVFTRMLLHSLFLNILLWKVAISFNYEDRDPLVKKAPDDQEGSYFGFSVAQHSTEELNGVDNTLDKYWILVGAPLGKNLQPHTNHSGALFKCPVSNDECVQVETDGKRVGEFDYDDDAADRPESALSAPGDDEIKNGQWLGVTVRSQRPGGVAMVCAHRYVHSPELVKAHLGLGLCYLLDNELVTYDTLSPCKGREADKLHQQFGLCQAGTSASFVGDTFALMGTPGSYTWRGTVFSQAVVGEFLSKDKTVYHGPFGDVNIIDKYSYLGMSVTGGHIFNKSDYTYVSGAPRSKLFGQVYFFKKNYLNEELNISLIITGEQFASSFGYEVLAADVNADGYDDVLVGAPFYYGDNKGGAVYVYYNLRECRSDDCPYSKVLHGMPQSRFGFSMTLLGDINKDGYNDVAIGAPYEDDQGAVYIYLGSKNGLNDEPSQVIRSSVKSLGYSLSGGMDMDNNGYPDLLVGAFESDRVLLFKARPIIDIKIKIKSDDMTNVNATKKGCSALRQNNFTCFSFESCLTIVGELKNSGDFEVIYNVAEENRFVHRIWFVDNTHPHNHLPYHKKTISIKNNKKTHCVREIVNIKEGVSDILSPIKFRVNYTLENNSYHTPILNKTSVKLFEATFQKECGDDDRCESNLTLIAGSNLQKDENGYYKVDSINNDFVLDVNITNSGESAYETKLFVFHPKALSYIALKDVSSNVKCSVTNDTLVVCDIGNPFQRSIDLKLRFEILKDSKDATLKLNLFVNSTSIELSKNTSQIVKVVLQKIAKLQITGKASSNLFYGGKIMGESAMHHLEDIGARVVHKYQIDNNGQWDLSDVKVNVLWPIQVTSGPDRPNRPGKWLLYLESTPVVHGVGIEGYCDVLDRTKINELHLNMSKENDEPENWILPEDFMTQNDTSHVRRRRRSINYVVPFETTERGGRRRKIVQLECAPKTTASCVEITCTIRKLNRGNLAEIDIKSRIWNSTLVEDYSNVDWVVVKSTATVEITDPSFNISSDGIFSTSAQTIAYPEIVSTDSELNWVIIGGAVFAGLLLLIILIIILCKCGFFERKRFDRDQTLSGNLQKKEEADHLLGKQ